MNNKVSNPKTEVPQTIELNDCNYLDELLTCEKNMAGNLQIALNEASNQNLYNEIKAIFDEVQNMQRKVFNLAFEKGWYSLEKADALKVSQKMSELNQKLSELI